MELKKGDKLFGFIFDLITEPLGLPIEWYYEWIILLAIGEIAYRVAYDKVGIIYHSGAISGKIAGSFVHWIIRIGIFGAMWTIAYVGILISKFVMVHKIQFIIGICSIVGGVITAKLIAWTKKRNELVTVSVKIEDNDK